MQCLMHYFLIIIADFIISFAAMYHVNTTKQPFKAIAHYISLTTGWSTYKAMPLKESH